MWSCDRVGQRGSSPFPEDAAFELRAEEEEEERTGELELTEGRLHTLIFILK